MNDAGGWVELLLSSAGRLPRTPFLIAAAVLLGVAWLYAIVSGPILRAWTGWLVHPALLFCGACILCKRLHDRGRAGWWAALALLALVVAWPYPHGVVSLLFTPVLVWIVVDLGLTPGQRGPNGYGPDPAV